MALEEAGLRFHHADGTSGGTFNLRCCCRASRRSEACGRWRALDVRSFVVAAAVAAAAGAGRRIPRSATPTGIRERVFPALGVDVERIRAAQRDRRHVQRLRLRREGVHRRPAHRGRTSTCSTAGVSLPVFSPAVERDGRKLIDAVWIKDTNVAEALRRGAEELWLVWCIGNHGVYRDGAFQQYVHMIEIAANGALQKELALVRERGARLHVIRPRVPLPLDPDFFFGRVDAATLIAMGYRDAAAYLDAPHEDGVVPDAAATRMEDPVPGVAFRERLRANGLELRLGWEIDDLEALRRPTRAARWSATSRHPALGTRRLARSGRFQLDARRGDRRAQLRAVTRGAAPQPARPRPRGGADRRRRTGRGWRAAARRPGGPCTRAASARRARAPRARHALLALAQKCTVNSSSTGGSALARAQPLTPKQRTRRRSGVGIQAQELLEERRIVPVEELRGEAVEAVLRGRRLEQARSDPCAPRELHRALSRGRHVQQLAEVGRRLGRGESDQPLAPTREPLVVELGEARQRVAAQRIALELRPR